VSLQGCLHALQLTMWILCTTVCKLISGCLFPRAFRKHGYQACAVLCSSARALRVSSVLLWYKPCVVFAGKVTFIERRADGSRRRLRDSCLESLSNVIRSLQAEENFFHLHIHSPARHGNFGNAHTMHCSSARTLAV